MALRNCLLNKHTHELPLLRGDLHATEGQLRSFRAQALEEIGVAQGMATQVGQEGFFKTKGGAGHGQWFG